MSATFLSQVPGAQATFLTSQGGVGQARFASSTPSTIVAGNAAANMANTGPMSTLVGVFQDDTGNPWNLPIDFYFLGTNYGKNLNGGMGWDSNFVISFSASSGTITWSSTVPGILVGGNYDRGTNSFYYSGALTSGSAQYVNCLVRGRNYFNDGLDNALRYQIRLIRDLVYQYVEIRVEAGATNQGAWQIAGGPAGGNVYIATGAYIGTGQSGVWRSSLTGTGWTWFANSYVNI